MRPTKLDQAKHRLEQILNGYTRDILDKALQDLVKNSCENDQIFRKLMKLLKAIFLAIFLLLAVKYYYEEMQGQVCEINELIQFYKEIVIFQNCVLSLPRTLRYALRPPEKCDFCANVKNVPRLQNLSPQEFETKYAYNAAPVIVSDATQNWTAVRVLPLETAIKIFK